jgi:hypothetical protein
MTYETILTCPNCGFAHRLVADDVVADRDRLTAALRIFTAKVIEHVDALPAEDEEWTDDEAPILSSLRMWATGDPGCTEEADYSPDEWATLGVLAALRAGEDAE